MEAHNPSGVFHQFISNLNRLGAHPDKNLIDSLARQAGILKDTQLAPHLIHKLLGPGGVLLQAPPGRKIPLMYVVDCILKNERGPFPSLSEEHIVRVFCDAFHQCHDADRTRLYRMLKTWERYSLFQHRIRELFRFVQPWVDARQAEVLRSSLLTPPLLSGQSLPRGQR